MIGSHLSEMLAAEGHTFSPLLQSDNRPEEIAHLRPKRKIDVTDWTSVFALAADFAPTRSSSGRAELPDRLVAAARETLRANVIGTTIVFEPFAARLARVSLLRVLGRLWLRRTRRGPV